MTEYKSTKIPIEVYEATRMALAKLLANGIDSLPEEIRNPVRCPNCGGIMDEYEVRTRLQYKKCRSCGYSQPVIDVLASGPGSRLFTLGLGVLLGLGIAALFYLLNNGRR